MLVAQQDVADVAERRRDRHRRAALTSATNVAGRIVTLVATLATIPAVFESVSRELFGLWMVLSSLTALLAFCDLGVGNGVINAVADADGQEDGHRMRALVSSAAALLSAIAVAFLAVAAIVLPSTDWAQTFGLTTDSAIQQAPAAVTVFALCFAASIPLSLASRVQVGLQRGFIAGVWQALGSVVSLAAILLCVRLDKGLPWMVAGLLGGPLLSSLLNSIVFFWFSRPDLRPSWSLVGARFGKELFRLGSLFLVLQIAVSVAFSSDNLIAARIIGAKAVADYAIAARIFGVVSVLVGIFLQPLWPAYSESIARRDLAWVRRTLRASTAAAVLLASVLALALLAAFDTIVQAWLHRALDVSHILLIGLAMWTVLEAAGNSLSMFLNGARVVGLQVILATAFAVTCVVAKVVVVDRFGVQGLPWATIVSYSIVTLLPVSLLLKKVLARL